MREINLKDWEKFGEGGEGETYISKTNEGLMLKLYQPFVDTKKIEREFNVCDFFAQKGINTPKAFELVKYENRTGIIFERVINKKSLNQLFKEEPWNIEKYSKVHAQMLKQLHSIDSSDLFPDFATQYAEAIDYGKESGLISPEEAAKLQDMLSKAKRDKIIMIDPHPGNIIIANDTPYLIDLGGSCNGDPMFDIGIWYAFAHDLVNESNHLEVTHVSRETHYQSWKYFVKEYFNITSEEEIKKIEETVKPYAFITMLWANKNFANIVNQDTDFRSWISNI